MQPHKNSTPLGIHTRRRISRRVASMRCSTSALKKGQTKAASTGHQYRCISVLPWRVPTVVPRSPECTAVGRITCDGMHCPRAFPNEETTRARDQKPDCLFAIRQALKLKLESDTAVFTLVQYDRNAQKVSYNRNYF